MRFYIGYIGAACIVIPIGALIARFIIQGIAAFKPRYSAIILSTSIASLIGVLITLVLRKYANIREPNTASGIQFAVGLCVLSICHSRFIKDATGQHLALGKSLIAAFCQIFGALISLLIILRLILFIKRGLS